MNRPQRKAIERLLDKAASGWVLVYVDNADDCMKVASRTDALRQDRHSHVAVTALAGKVTSLSASVNARQRVDYLSKIADPNIPMEIPESKE